jgi:hypothetical protein
MYDFHCIDVMQLLVTINTLFVACGTVSLVLLASDCSSPKTPRSVYSVLYIWSTMFDDVSFKNSSDLLHAILDYWKLDVVL